MPRRFSVLRRIQLSTALTLAIASWLGTAAATPEYPGVIDATVGMSCGAPASRCLICHTTARGGQGTAEQPFVRHLRTLGLTHGHDASALRNAINLLDENWDSDGDTEPDKKELRECGNPSGDDLGAGPEYGCDGAQLVTAAAARRSSSSALGVLALGLAGVLVHFARRR
jgi:hypothetical protein